MKVCCGVHFDMIKNTAVVCFSYQQGETHATIRTQVHYSKG